MKTSSRDVTSPCATEVCQRELGGGRGRGRRLLFFAEPCLGKNLQVTHSACEEEGVTPPCATEVCQREREAAVGAGLSDASFEPKNLVLENPAKSSTQGSSGVLWENSTCLRMFCLTHPRTGRKGHCVAFVLRSTEEVCQRVLEAAMGVGDASIF